MGVMGFGAKQEDQVKDALKDLQTVLHTESLSLQRFENGLYLEIREIEEFKKNCLILEQYAVTCNNIFNAREEVVKELHQEVNKNRVDINIQKCKDLLHHINRSDDSLQTALSTVYREMDRHLLRETHELYHQEESNRSIIKEMDKKLRATFAEIIVIRRKNDGISAGITLISQDIQKLEGERNNRTEKSPPIGFHP